jgi:hypothetical protein
MRSARQPEHVKTTHNARLLRTFSADSDTASEPETFFRRDLHPIRSGNEGYISISTVRSQLRDEHRLAKKPQRAPGDVSALVWVWSMVSPCSCSCLYSSGLAIQRELHTIVLFPTSITEKSSTESSNKPCPTADDPLDHRTPPPFARRSRRASAALAKNLIYFRIDPDSRCAP